LIVAYIIYFIPVFYKLFAGINLTPIIVISGANIKIILMINKKNAITIRQNIMIAKKKKNLNTFSSILFLIISDNVI